MMKDYEYVKFPFVNSGEMLPDKFEIQEFNSIEANIEFFRSQLNIKYQLREKQQFIISEVNNDNCKYLVVAVSKLDGTLTGGEFAIFMQELSKIRFKDKF